MTLAEVRDWLKTFGLFDYYYIGKLNGSKEKALGVYTRSSGGRPVHALGGPSTYIITGIKVVIHGTENQNETQELALALFRALTDVSPVNFEDNTIYYVDLRVTEPADIGTDANKKYQYVINFDIYSNRR